MSGETESRENGRAGPADRLEEWERIVVNAVGDAIQFWGFKWNHGRVWCVLYLRGTPMSAAELKSALGLSKGAASIITRELEQWGTIRRVRVGSDPVWVFEAETDFMGMVGRVIRERESKLVSRLRGDLGRARDLGSHSGKASEEALRRISKMERAAALFQASMGLFLKTSKFDFSKVVSALRGRAL
ncbi:MAG: transcriptional regulator [Pseudomonadota bacterium]